jgi:hypothetical protein
MVLGSARFGIDRLLAIAFVLFVTLALAGIVSTDTAATFTGAGTNPTNTLGSAQLAAPTSLAATITSNGGTVNLSWTATTSAWATGTRIYRATVSGGPYSLAGTIVGLGTTTWSEAPGSSIYYYVARAYFQNWESANSNQITAKPLNNFGFAAILTQHSGTAFSVTITARAQDNSTVTGFTGTVSLSTNNSATISPLTSGAFTAGARTESITVTGAYKTNQTVTATGGTPSQTGTSAAFTLNHFHATVIALNNTTTAGRVVNGDTMVFTFSEAANTASIGTCSGATNSSTDISFNNVNPDTVTLTGAAGRVKLGTIALGNNGYMTATDVANNSTCAWSGGNTVLTITVAGIAAGNTATVAGASTATWTPDGTLTSALGETIDATVTPSVTAVLF